jgi:hypothetical protein
MVMTSRKDLLPPTEISRLTAAHMFRLQKRRTTSSDSRQTRTIVTYLPAAHQGEKEPFWHSGEALSALALISVRAPTPPFMASLANVLFAGILMLTVDRRIGANPSRVLRCIWSQTHARENLVPRSCQYRERAALVRLTHFTRLTE